MTNKATPQPKPAPALLPYQRFWLADVELLQIREKARCTGLSQERRDQLHPKP